MVAERESETVVFPATENTLKNVLSQKKRILTKYSLTSHPKWLHGKGGVLLQK
jgi:hypothetical protein